jgi:hypothetical protein
MPTLAPEAPKPTTPRHVLPAEVRSPQLPGTRADCVLGALHGPRLWPWRRVPGGRDSVSRETEGKPDQGGREARVVMAWERGGA